MKSLGPKALPMVGGHFHGCMHVMQDPDINSVRMLIPVPVPVMVEAMHSGKDEIDLTIRTQTYQLMKIDGNSFLGCTDIPQKELVDQYVGYRSRLG